MPRFHGRVKTFFLNEGFGHIVELGETESGSFDNIVSDRDVYFRVSDMSLADPGAIVPKATTGEILEYERTTDDQGRHRAHNITGLYQTALQCQEGLLVFKRYSDMHREVLRREGERAVDEYVRAQSGSSGHSGRGNRGRRGGGGGRNSRNPPRRGDRSRSRDGRSRGSTHSNRSDGGRAEYQGYPGALDSSAPASP